MHCATGYDTYYANNRERCAPTGGRVFGIQMRYCGPSVSVIDTTPSEAHTVLRGNPNTSSRSKHALGAAGDTWGGHRHVVCDEYSATARMAHISQHKHDKHTSTSRVDPTHHMAGEQHARAFTSIATHREGDGDRSTARVGETLRSVPVVEVPTAAASFTLALRDAIKPAIVLRWSKEHDPRG